MKRTPEQVIELYQQTARTSADAALDETKPLALRSYYAGLALHYDKKAAKALEQQGES